MLHTTEHNPLTDLEQILEQPLNTDNPHALAAQLSQRAAWQARVSVQYREAEETLARAKGQLFNPSLSSEDKRKIDLLYQVREQQKAVDLFSDQSDILKQHISLGQSLLRSMESEMKVGARL